MKYSCEIIRDLLPLYTDKVCSEESRAAVTEHLAGCPACRTLCDKLQNETIETALREETDGILRKQAKRIRRRSATIGSVITGILLVPVIVCLIVNLAVGAALDWFFLVLASLLVTASVSAVPFWVPANRGLWTLGSFSASLVLLLGVCCLYTGGDWFFVASLSSLFGIGVVFLPAVVRTSPLRRVLGNGKALAVMAADTLLYAGMMCAIGAKVSHPDYPRLAFAFSLPCLVFAWLVFLCLRYLPAKKIAKAGICAILSGAFLFFFEGIVSVLIASPVPLPHPRPEWTAATIDGNIKWMILVAGTVIGGILILCGLFTRGKEKKK